jgi:hypothetical protein
MLWHNHTINQILVKVPHHHIQQAKAIIQKLPTSSFLKKNRAFFQLNSFIFQV